MSKGKTLMSLLLLLLVQSFLLGIIIFDHYMVRSHGHQVMVAVDTTHPVTEVGNTSLNFNCKGMYVQTPTLEEELHVGAKVFATYEQQEDGNIRLEKYYLSRREVPEGKPYLEARVRSIESVTTEDSSGWASGGKSSQYLVHMYLNFFRMYLAPVIQDQLQQQMAQPHQNISLQVTVWQGKGILSGIEIDGEWKGLS